MENIKVFYSFHYDDVKNFKANIIRNTSRIKCFQGLLTDKSIWEQFKESNVSLIKERINNSELVDSDATVVLIGQQTHSRTWVKYEIIKSFQFGNSLIGVHINRIKGRTGITPKGLNPFERLGFKYFEDEDILRFYELNNRSWKPYAKLPVVKF